MTRTTEPLAFGWGASSCAGGFGPGGRSGRRCGGRSGRRCRWAVRWMVRLHDPGAAARSARRFPRAAVFGSCRRPGSGSGTDRKGDVPGPGTCPARVRVGNGPEGGRARTGDVPGEGTDARRGDECTTRRPDWSCDRVGGRADGGRDGGLGRVSVQPWVSRRMGDGADARRGTGGRRGTDARPGVRCTTGRGYGSGGRGGVVQVKRGERPRGGGIGRADVAGSCR